MTAAEVVFSGIIVSLLQPATFTSVAKMVMIHLGMVSDAHVDMLRWTFDLKMCKSKKGISRGCVFGVFSFCLVFMLLVEKVTRRLYTDGMVNLTCQRDQIKE